MIDANEERSELIDSLECGSLEAFKNGHYLESAVIIFQTVENLLRILLAGSSRAKGVDPKISAEISENENSFYKLVLYLNLLEPDNELLDRLYAFGTERNNIIHKLFGVTQKNSKFKGAMDYQERL